MAQTIRVEDDVYAALLQIAAEQTIASKKRISQGEAVRFLIWFCPNVDKSNLKVPLRRY